MAEVGVEDFDTWLTERLKELKTDEAVFGPYIISILEEDEDIEEKIEALEGILVELGNNVDVESLRKEILKRWEDAVLVGNRISIGNDAKTSKLFNLQESQANDEEVANVDKQLEQLLRLTSDEIQSSSSLSAGGAAAAAKIPKELNNPPDSAIRAAILSQYCGSDSDSTDDAHEGKKKSGDSRGDIDRNDNAERVLTDQKEHKEKARQDAAKKRERDREDRAKQKQAAQERKDKAKKKATKVERKR